MSVQESEEHARARGASGGGWTGGDAESGTLSQFPFHMPTGTLI